MARYGTVVILHRFQHAYVCVCALQSCRFQGGKAGRHTYPLRVFIGFCLVGGVGFGISHLEMRHCIIGDNKHPKY